MSTSTARRERFVNVFESIRDELVNYFASEAMPKDAVEWYKRNLDYNVPGGKLNRGVSVIDTVEILLGRPLDDFEYKRAAVLGWCVELLQSFFLVSDDMIDGSITRRGQPCWYRASGVGLIAVNDSVMLEGAIYHLLKTYFRGESYYVDLLEVLHETSYKTEMGQLVDMITASEGVVDLSKFSLQKHQFIVVHKTAYYSFYLPVALAMHVCGITAPSSFDLASKILIPLGEYFQAQDDYLDCFGTHEQIGKIGTDIVDNKCSWLINVALAHASTEQRKVLDECYGRKDAEKERRVKEIYHALGLQKRYEDYEQSSYEKIMGLIETIPEGGQVAEGNAVPLTREVFESFLGKIYKRTK